MDDDSDSDSSVEMVLNRTHRTYSFLRNSLITNISSNSSTSQAVLENDLETQVKQQKVTDTKPIENDLETQVEQQKVTDTKSTDKVNECRSSRYDNLTLEELSNIAERIKIYHEVGVVVPEKIVPCKNKYKRKNSKKPAKLQQSIRKRKTTFGQGRIGTVCSAFGVKHCMCCNVDKENFNTVDEQNALLISGNNCNSSVNRFPINELTQYQLETGRSNIAQELDPLTRTENEQSSTVRRIQSMQPPVTNSEPAMSQVINLRGRTVQKTVKNLESPLRENERDCLVTSTPININHRSHHLNRINSCNNPLDISDIVIDNVEANVECFIEESQSTSEIIQKRNNYVEKEDQIMEYVNDLLGTTADTIAEEVEERYQRLDETRRAASNAISNAINPNHDAVHEEMDIEHSVILVSVGSPQPIVVDDSIIETNNVVEETYLSTGVRTRSRAMASASSSNVWKTCQDVEVVETTSEPKKQTGGSVALHECSICLESLAKKELSATTCGHVFCTECIKAAIRTSKMCPNCRTGLTLKKIHPLYL